VSNNLFERGHHARVSQLSGKPLSHRANITASKSFSAQTDYRFDIKTFLALRKGRNPRLRRIGLSKRTRFSCRTACSTCAAFTHTLKVFSPSTMAPSRFRSDLREAQRHGFVRRPGRPFDGMRNAFDVGYGEAAWAEFDRRSLAHFAFFTSEATGMRARPARRILAVRWGEPCLRVFVAVERGNVLRMACSVAPVVSTPFQTKDPARS
jgi:hypothetical protein